MTRLLAIGDIHGRLDLLDRLLAQVRPTAADRLVFLGDYIDRGPESRGVLERLLQLREALPATVFLRGNHEQLLLDALAEAGRLPHWTPLRRLSPRFAAEASGSDLQLWLYNGGVQVLLDYGICADSGAIPDFSLIPAPHLDFLQTTRLWHAENGILFVHAGADPGREPAEQDPYLLLWGRRLPPLPAGAPLQVVGHTPTRDGRPLREGGRLYLDTGAVYGRALACCDLLSDALWLASDDEPG